MKYLVPVTVNWTVIFIRGTFISLQTVIGGAIVDSCFRIKDAAPLEVSERRPLVFFLFVLIIYCTYISLHFMYTNCFGNASSCVRSSQEDSIVVGIGSGSGIDKYLHSNYSIIIIHSPIQLIAGI